MIQPSRVPLCASLIRRPGMLRRGEGLLQSSIRAHYTRPYPTSRYHISALRPYTRRRQSSPYSETTPPCPPEQKLYPGHPKHSRNSLGWCCLGLLWRNWGLECDDERVVHVPAEFLASLKKQCQEELDEAVKRGEIDEGVGLELSKNDVLSAWLFKGAYVTFPPSELDINFGFNYRSLLDPLPPNQLYLHNSFYNIRASFPSLSEFQSAPLYRIALQLRLTVLRNKQPSAVKAALQFWEQNVNTLIAPNPPDRPMGVYFIPIISHWLMFEYHSLDFSGAEKKGSEDGKVVYTQPMIVLPFGLMSKPIATSVRDERGDYWIRLNLLHPWWQGYGLHSVNGEALSF